MKLRLLSLATLAAAMIFAGGSTSEAAFMYTVSETMISSTFKVNNTQITFDPSVLPASATSASSFNIADVGASSTTVGPPNDSGSTTFTEVLTIVDNAGHSETVTLTGTLILLSGSTGGIATRFINPTITVGAGGSGFDVTDFTYSPPTAGSAGTGLTGGSFGITVTPNVVPEPASIAMLGLGLVSVGGLSLRRRMAK
jgi:PEP-CTERM motif